MIKKKITLWVVIAATVVCSCDENYIEVSKPQIVVEGWIGENDFPVVIVTQNIPISEDYTPLDDLSKYIVKWAKVSVSDGSDSVILTGKYDKGYYPPYIYTTGRMRGKAGKKYMLKVEYDDKTITASTTIPLQSPKVNGTSVERCEESDTLYKIAINFTDDAFQKNYYQFFTCVGARNKQFLASYLGSIDDAVLNGTTNFTVYRGRQITDFNNYTPYFSVNDTVSVKLAQIDEVSYTFWDEFSKTIANASNMFLAPYTNIHHNISGGTGYWCGMNDTILHFRMSDYKTVP